MLDLRFWWEGYEIQRTRIQTSGGRSLQLEQKETGVLTACFTKKAEEGEF